MKTKIVKIEKEKYVCEECGKEFDYESSCVRHENEHGLGMVQIETRYDSHDGSERKVITYNNEEYDSIEDFEFESGLDFRYHVLKIIAI